MKSSMELRRIIFEYGHVRQRVRFTMIVRNLWKTLFMCSVLLVWPIQGLVAKDWSPNDSLTTATSPAAYYDAWVEVTQELIALGLRQIFQAGQVQNAATATVIDGEETIDCDWVVDFDETYPTLSVRDWLFEGKTYVLLVNSSKGEANFVLNNIPPAVYNELFTDELHDAKNRFLELSLPARGVMMLVSQFPPLRGPDDFMARQARNALDAAGIVDNAVKQIGSDEDTPITLVSLDVAPSGDETGLTDTLAIQAALDAATDNAENETLIALAAGEFYLNDDLIVGPSHNLTVRGTGAGLTILNLLSCGQLGFRLMAPQTLGQAIQNLTIEQLSLRGILEDADQSNVCLQVGIGNSSGQVVHGATYRHLEITNVSVGISANADLGGVFTGARIIANHLADIHGTDSGRGYGIHAANAYGARIYDNWVERAERHSIYQARGSNVRIWNNTLIDHRSTVADGSIRAAMAVARSSLVVVYGNRFIRSHDVALAIGPDPEQPGIAHDIYVFYNDFDQSSILDFYIGSQQGADGQVCTDGYPESIYAFGNRFWRDHAGAAVRIDCGKEITFAKNRWVSVNDDQPITELIRLISILHDENYTGQVLFQKNCGRLETTSIASAYYFNEGVANGSGSIQLLDNVWNADVIVDPSVDVFNPNLIITDSLQDVECLD